MIKWWKNRWARRLDRWAEHNPVCNIVRPVRVTESGTWCWCWSCRRTARLFDKLLQPDLPRAIVRKQ